MVGSGSTFSRAGLSEAFISTVGATFMAVATPWKRLSWTTRMFSSFPRMRTHLENGTLGKLRLATEILASDRS